MTAVDQVQGMPGCINTCKSNAPASFSNWLPASNTDKKATTIAAPGVGTYSLDNTGSGYVTMSGTSMACPHVAGMMAACLAPGGACQGLNVPNAIARLVNISRCVQGSHGWSADPSCASASATRFYGYLAVGGPELRASSGTLGSCPPPATCACGDQSNRVTAHSSTHSQTSTGTLTQLSYKFTRGTDPYCTVVVSISGGSGARVSFGWRQDEAKKGGGVEGCCSLQRRRQRRRR